ncbi:MAG: hypothetical protein LBU83_09840 [Bacteroidales bacterium]|jgi:hypothetical protein|nr:hypothetical protein [Bacteroidales bacterium]
MKKRLILFLVILANISFAQNFGDDRVREHYYQLLLEKWQESANWQDLEIVDTTSMLALELIAGIARKATKGYHNSRELICFFSIHGEQQEYALALMYKLPDNKQMWLLISRINRNVLSIYKDEVEPNLPVEEQYMRGKAYISLVPILDIDIIIPCLSSWEPRWPNMLSSDNKEIDSITAISIATEAAEKCYGVKMTPFAEEDFFIFDINYDNWDVQEVSLLPTIKSDKERQQRCLDNYVFAYNRGRLRLMQNTPMWHLCPPPLQVLILKKDGRVLKIEKLW